MPSTHFLKINNPSTSYILGYLWADGSIRNKHKSIKLKIKKDDYDNIRPILFSIGKWSESEIKPKSDKHSIKTEARFNNKIIYKFLLDNDYYIKSIASPEKILDKIPLDLRSYFFRGYFDGDGCIQKYTTSLSGDYAQDWTSIEKLLTQMNVKYTIIKQINPKRKGRSSRIIMYGKENRNKFLSYIYLNRANDKIGLNRKFNKYTEYFNDELVPN